LKGFLTFIPHYNIEVAEKMVAGCDVWLNTPIVGREACGTSGMKAALNGTLNLSTNDGWIAEVPLADFGWLIDDQNISKSILDTIEQRILPIYDSSDWQVKMQNSRDFILKNFSTTRMLNDYIKKLYLPSLTVPQKKLVAFDVDNTLSLSRTKIDTQMVDLLKKLLEKKQVAIITGGAFADITKQILKPLNLQPNLAQNLILLPTNGGGLWLFDQINQEWREVSVHKLTAEQKEKITEAIREVDQADPELRDNKSFGQEIQDRESEITYSALGDHAPVKLKHDWDPDFKKRLILQQKLEEKLPEFEVKIGGTTSIDITPKGMDKAYGIKVLLDHFGLQKSDILFIGDAIYPDGNDYPVAQFGVDTIKVENPEDTKKVIRDQLA
jgi:phosphomannomutase